MKPIKINNPLIVGYKGEIGSFILNGLLKIMPKALNIWCVDVNETEPEIIERIQKSDTIFLCVPMKNTVEWMINYHLLLKNKIIIEQTSLKGWLTDKKWLSDKRLRELDVRSMHILFRPSQTPNICDRKVALITGQTNCTNVAEIEAITQSSIVWFNSIEEHDKEMAIQQALVHRTLLVLGKALENCHSSTYVSQKVLDLCERIKKGNLDLYKVIQENKNLDAPLNKFIDDFENFKIEYFWKK
jgi:prephenate dehydrogenase